AAYPGPNLDIFSAKTPDVVLWAALIGLWIAGISFLIGYQCRLCAAILFIGITSLCQRNLAILSSAESVLRIALFLLVFAPANLPFSVDRALYRLRGGTPPATVVPVVQRFMQVQVAVVYLSTVLWKAQGYAWVHGTAAYYGNNLLVFHSPLLEIPLRSIFLVNIATYGTLATEFCLAMFAWFPAVRKPVLLAGVALHSAIAWNMHLWFFSSMMISTYICFLEGKEVARMLQPLRSRRRALVFYDGSCGFCLGTRHVLESFDLLGALAWRDFREAGALQEYPEVDPAECERALQLVLPGRPGRTRRVYGGFAAFRQIAWRLPILWLLAPLLYLPGAKAVGDRLYARIAARRFDLAPCGPDGAACRVGPQER
ncbi:MAG: DUF393 domain-containing protein, partial [Cyanobacteria bacterium REEB65]|nr:DUF393 domain-containing protein [Cyanobacteria bacterium REEB65]